MLDHIA